MPASGQNAYEGSWPQWGARLLQPEPAAPTPWAAQSSPPGYLSLTNEMIDTFNLELNLLTFSSERDILTGGMGWESQGKMDVCLLTCPASSLPAVEHPERCWGWSPSSGWTSHRAEGSAITTASGTGNPAAGRRLVGTCSWVQASEDRAKGGGRPMAFSSA